MPNKPTRKYGPTEPVTPKYTPKQVQDILNATDWNEYRREVDWEVWGKLMRCSCVMCPEYTHWIEAGKELYGTERKDELEKTLKEVEAHRANARAARELDRMTNERNGLVSLMAAA